MQILLVSQILVVIVPAAHSLVSGSIKIVGSAGGIGLGGGGGGAAQYLPGNYFNIFLSSSVQDRRDTKFKFYFCEQIDDKSLNPLDNINFL